MFKMCYSQQLLLKLFPNTDLFLHLPNTSENQRFGDVFRSAERDQWHEMG